MGQNDWILPLFTVAALVGPAGWLAGWVLLAGWLAGRWLAGWRLVDRRQPF